METFLFCIKSYNKQNTIYENTLWSWDDEVHTNMNKVTNTRYGNSIDNLLESQNDPVIPSGENVQNQYKWQ